MKVTLSLLLCFLVLPLSIADYHYDTRRGPRDYKRPSYTSGLPLLKSRKKSKPNDFVFGINTADQFSRPLLLTRVANAPINGWTGPRELTSEHLVEVAPTFEFVKKVLGDGVGKLGDTLDIRWLIIEKMQYSIDRVPVPARHKKYYDPMYHLKSAVGSGTFPDELVIMTKDLNNAKSPLIQGREAITEEMWTKLANPKPKFEAAAHIATVAETALHPIIRKHTKAQMQRLTLTVGTWDLIYNEWYCSYQKDRTVWDKTKRRIKAELARAKVERNNLKTAHENNYNAKKAANPHIPPDTKIWPEVNEDLPVAPPDPSKCTETFEQEWITYQKNIYVKFRAQVKDQLDQAKQRMRRDYVSPGDCLHGGGGQAKEYEEAVSRISLPPGWESGSGVIIEDDDFVPKTRFRITKDPNC